MAKLPKKNAKKKYRPTSKLRSSKRSRSFFKKFHSIFQNKVIRLAFKLMLLLAVVIGSIIALFIGYCSLTLPDIEKLSEDNSRPHIIIRAEDGSVLSNYGDIYGRSIPYGRLPKVLVNAVLATEDKRFFDHRGIDYLGIIRAAYKNKVAGKIVEGGSTVTQQLVKIVFLSPERSIKRKTQEILLSIKLEKIFSKQQIMAMYLNRVFLGHANYGVDAAARNYFGKDVERLTLYEAAFIAAMLKAPARYAPPAGTELALARAKRVLSKMAAAGFIKQNQADRAIEPKFINMSRPSGLLVNQFFSDYILSKLPYLIPSIRGNLDIRTTFSLDIQHKLENAVEKNLNHKDKRQVAAIVMTKDGKIRGMLGGRSYTDSQFNRAVMAKRQPGSVFKIFVYLAALESGYSCDSIVMDSPINIGKWQPKNFTRSYMGKVSFIDSFAYSLNTVAVNLSETIGREKVINMARRVGIDTQLRNNPSIALGTSEVTLLDLIFGYATIANNGVKPKDLTISTIVDSQKEVLYRQDKRVSSNVLEKKVISQIKELLRASVLYGTSKVANVDGYEVYGKTGTTQDHRDAWFIGFVNDLVIGIWVGNDDNKSMINVTGGTIPSKIFRDLLKSL